MEPILVIFGPAPLRADLPESVVLVDDGGHEVVWLVLALHGEGLCVGIVGAAVRIVTDRMLLCPWPDVPIK